MDFKMVISKQNYSLNNLIKNVNKTIFELRISQKSKNHEKT